MDGADAVFWEPDLDLHYAETESAEAAGVWAQQSIQL